MTVFRVWAPQATWVEIQIGAERSALIAEARGWWSIAVPSAGPGTDYAFILDGAEPLPDPRSP